MLDDLILVLDDPGTCVLELLDGEEELVLEDTLPFVPYYDVYTGPYEVTPTFSDQTLDTDTKAMIDDVLVHEIPVTYTTNPYGGKTVLIG